MDGRPLHFAIIWWPVDYPSGDAALVRRDRLEVLWVEADVDMPIHCPNVGCNVWVRVASESSCTIVSFQSR